MAQICHNVLTKSIAIKNSTSIKSLKGFNRSWNTRERLLSRKVKSKRHIFELYPMQNEFLFVVNLCYLLNGVLKTPLPSISDFLNGGLNGDGKMFPDLDIPFILTVTLITEVSWHSSVFLTSPLA